MIPPTRYRNPNSKTIFALYDTDDAVGRIGVQTPDSPERIHKISELFSSLSGFRAFCIANNYFQI